MQIQENSNSQLEIQQDGTSASTATTGTQGVHTVPATNYSQGVLDFQGIAIGVKTLLSPGVVTSLAFIIYALVCLWFAVKNDDPSMLAPIPFGLMPEMVEQAPLEQTHGIEVQAPLELTQETEVQD